LREQLNAVPDRSDVIVVGHSLGSVIALDALCSWNGWHRFASVSIVTVGSPIHRFFQRFFPGLYFPSATADCVAHIQSRMNAVRWLNVFRAGYVRGDPVGQRLFFRGNTGTDLPIRQRRRILMQAHLDYWDDHEVLQTVEGAWDRTLPPLTV